uniref:Uncharacterized protein n=1 Tax=Panagrolaimus sp. ES5 TaxID=591445 RepID=A0AC34G0L4_9BILA
MSSKLILICFLFAFAAVAIVHSQVVYTSPYVYPVYSYPSYYGWIWGSNKNGSPPSTAAAGAPSGAGGAQPSFTNSDPKL